MPEFIHIHPNDNVAVALTAIAAGTEFAGVIARADIPQGHKMALKAMEENDQVIKYGFSIGHATNPIQPGDWVHTHNMKTNLSGEIEYTYNPNITHPAPQQSGTFMGFRRGDGKVGIRNEIWIIPTVGCVNDIAKAMVRENQDLVSGSVEELVHAVMTNEQMWGQDLTKIPGFEAATVANLKKIREEGAMAAYAACL